MADDGRPRSGLFYNRITPSLVPVRTESIADGAANTLMFSENIHATRWNPPLDSTTYTWTGLVPGSQDWREAHVGMVWWDPNLIASRYTPMAGSNPAWVTLECYRINHCKDETVPTLDILFARPSSNHTGGVVATFADGHQDFIQDDVDYGVFRQMMTPDD